ncbi:Rab-GTPase-TBC domain [Carpediemonas membranifera]|uniref:Rab-GTPase-TBC domain n=1 Tax=Carpediemonas membranifera TaxID=201153 RepID=A0A8J6AQK0_9EUKA|nr:Rab-GTPase-TBC domain [Carpediemonas membranifera]|eukprot:KAG9389435.1 Rab-GTPase-TBC domain [Carpediemonas membranifera]
MGSSLNAERIKKLVDNCKLDELRRIGQETGFQDARIRRIAWPYLIRSFGDVKNFEIKENTTSSFSEQIALDTKRSCFKYFASEKAWDEMSEESRAKAHSKVEEMQNKLNRVLNMVFSQGSSLHYYQGFNDLANTVMSVITDESECAQLCHHLAANQFSLCTTPSLAPVTDELSLIFHILGFNEQKLLDHLTKANLNDPFFAVGWVLTWFAHDIDNTEAIARMFDFMVCSHPLAAVYAATVVVLVERDGVLAREADYAEIYSFLRSIMTERDHEREQEWSKEVLRATSKVIAQKEKAMGPPPHFLGYVQMILEQTTALLKRMPPASFHTCTDVLFPKYPILCTSFDEEHLAKAVARRERRRELTRTVVVGGILGLAVVVVVAVASQGRAEGYT